MRNFKIGKTTYSKLQSITTYDDSKNNLLCILKKCDVLSTLLFNLCINDLPDFLNKRE